MHIWISVANKDTGAADMTGLLTMFIMKGNTSLQLKMSPVLHPRSWAPGTAAGENLCPFPLPPPLSPSHPVAMKP